MVGRDGKDSGKVVNMRGGREEKRDEGLGGWTLQGVVC